MFLVFQDTLLKWFGEEARLTRETGTTQYHIFGGVGGGEGTPAVWKQLRVVFCCLLCLVTPWRCHTTGATVSAIGNLSTPSGGSCIYLPSASKLSTGVEWRRSQWGPACCRNISLLTRMRSMGLTRFDIFLTSFESC